MDHQFRRTLARSAGLMLGVAGFISVLSACQTTPLTGPGVTVRSQRVSAGAVTVEQAFSAGPGWIVIHAQAEGKPGIVLGHEALQEGLNRNVRVTIDAAAATPVLYAMLHVDRGVIGSYEFPGPDVPATADGAVISPSFSTSVTSGYGSGGGMGGY
jgi:hypothetical protein